MTKRKFPYPCLDLSERDRLLRQFVQAATDSLSSAKPAAILVEPDTLRMLLYYYYDNELMFGAYKSRLYNKAAADKVKGA